MKSIVWFIICASSAAVVMEIPEGSGVQISRGCCVVQ